MQEIILTYFTKHSINSSHVFFKRKVLIISKYKLILYLSLKKSELFLKMNQGSKVDIDYRRAYM